MARSLSPHISPPTPVFASPHPHMPAIQPNLPAVQPDEHGAPAVGVPCPRYERMQPEPAPEADASASSSSSPSVPVQRPEVLAASASFQLSKATRVFEELPHATIFSVSRPEASEITPYTIEINYKKAMVLF